MQLLQERVAEADDSDEMRMKVGRNIVDFHGEIVLLENYSALNYTGWCWYCIVFLFKALLFKDEVLVFLALMEFNQWP